MGFRLGTRVCMIIGLPSKLPILSKGLLIGLVKGGVREGRYRYIIPYMGWSIIGFGYMGLVSGYVMGYASG